MFFLGLPESLDSTYEAGGKEKRVHPKHYITCHSANFEMKSASNRAVLVWAISLALLPLVVFGQEADPDDARRRQEVSSKKDFEILPAIAPSSSPELGLTLVGAAVMSFRPFPSDTVSLKTTVGTSLSISVKKAVVFGARINSYALEDKLRIEVDLSWRDLPDHYWGLGFDRASTISRSDSTTAYQRTAWLVKPLFLWRLTGNVFAGLNIDLNYTNAQDPNPVMKEDPDFIRFGPENYNSGTGIIARFDSRDLPTNAFGGVYAQALQTTYGSFLGGENS